MCDTNRDETLDFSFCILDRFKSGFQTVNWNRPHKLDFVENLCKVSLNLCLHYQRIKKWMSNQVYTEMKWTERSKKICSTHTWNGLHWDHSGTCIDSDTQTHVHTTLSADRRGWHRDRGNAWKDMKGGEGKARRAGNLWSSQRIERRRQV